jgi:hypothetical protein
MIASFFSESIAQSVKPESDLWSVVDSAILEETDGVFLKHMERDEIIVVTNDEYIIQYDHLDTNSQKVDKYLLGYTMKSYNGIILHIDQNDSNGGFGPCSIDFQIDNNLKIDWQSRIRLCELAINSLYKAPIIPMEEAIDSAGQYFRKGFKNTSTPLVLVYYEEGDWIEWRMTKFKGFMKGEKETVILNANTGQYIGYKLEPFQRYSIWQAIFQRSAL